MEARAVILEATGKSAAAVSDCLDKGLPATNAQMNISLKTDSFDEKTLGMCA